MEDLYRRYRDYVAFFVVYVQEAHPTDGWQTDSNVAEGILFRQHQSYEEREAVATTCSLDLHLPLPVLVEEMDNAIDEAYGAAQNVCTSLGQMGASRIRGALGPTSSTWRHGNRPLPPVCTCWQRLSIRLRQLCGRRARRTSLDTD